MGEEIAPSPRNHPHRIGRAGHRADTPLEVGRQQLGRLVKRAAAGAGHAPSEHH